MSKIPNQYHNGVHYPKRLPDNVEELRYAAVLKTLVKKRIDTLTDVKINKGNSYSLNELGKNIWNFERVNLPDLYSKMGLSASEIKEVEGKKSTGAKALVQSAGFFAAGLVAVAVVALVVIGIAGIVFSIALPFLLAFVWNVDGAVIFITYVLTMGLPIILPAVVSCIPGLIGLIICPLSWHSAIDSYHLGNHVAQRGIYLKLDNILEERVSKLKVAQKYLENIISDPSLEKDLWNINCLDLEIEEKKDKLNNLNWELHNIQLEEAKDKKEFSNLLSQMIPLNEDVDLFLREELSKLENIDNDYFYDGNTIILKSEKLSNLKNEFHAKTNSVDKINIYLKNFKARLNNKELQKKIIATLSKLEETHLTIERVTSEQHRLLGEILNISSQKTSLETKILENKKSFESKSLDLDIVTSILKELKTASCVTPKSNNFHRYVNHKITHQEKEHLKICIKTFEASEKSAKHSWYKLIDKNYVINKKNLIGTIFETDSRFLKNGQFVFDFNQLFDLRPDLKHTPQDIDLLFAFIQSNDKLNFDVSKITLEQLERLWFLAGYFQIPHFKDVLYNRYKDFLPSFTLEQCSKLYDMFDNTFTNQMEFKTWFVSHVKQLVSKLPVSLSTLSKLDYLPGHSIHEIILEEFLKSSNITRNNQESFNDWLTRCIDSLINEELSFKVLRDIKFDKDNKLHQMILDGSLKIKDKIKNSVIRNCLVKDFKEPEEDTLLQAFLDKFLPQSFYPELSSYIDAYLDCYHPLGKNESPLKIKIRKAIESAMVDGLTKPEHKDKLNKLLEQYRKDQALYGLALNCIAYS